MAAVRTPQWQPKLIPDDHDLRRVDLGARDEPVDRRHRGALVVVGGDPDLAEVAYALPGAVDAEDVHASAEEGVGEGVGERLLGHVHAGEEEHGRRLAPVPEEVEPALYLDALPGYLHLLDGVVGVAGDLVGALDVLAVEEYLLLVVVLEDAVLGLVVDLAGAAVQLARRVGVARGLGRLRDVLDVARLLVEDARDHPVRLDLWWEVALVVGEVLHPARRLHYPVQHPLLVVPLELGPRQN